MTKRDKGFAFDFGIRHLALDPPEILIMLGCRLQAWRQCDLRAGNDMRRHLSTGSGAVPHAGHHPNSSNNLQVAEFTWRVKNWLRPLGLKALGLPCQLMGTGMAFPWGRYSPVGSRQQLVRRGLKARDRFSVARAPSAILPTARVTSQFGASATAVRTQRAWLEPGHVR